MEKIRNWMISILVIVGVVFTIWYNVGQDQDQKEAGSENCQGTVGPQQGLCAPNFTLFTLDGKEVQLYENNGKPTLINFWATWCGPCKNEMPLLQSVYEQYQDNVNFLMINVTAQDDMEAVHQYILDHKYTFPVLLDPPDQENRSVSISDYKVQGIPMTLGLAPNGKIVYKKPGELSKQELETLINQLLKTQG